MAHLMRTFDDLCPRCGAVGNGVIAEDADGTAATYCACGYLLSGDALKIACEALEDIKLRYDDDGRDAARDMWRVAYETLEQLGWKAVEE